MMGNSSSTSPAPLTTSNLANLSGGLVNNNANNNKTPDDLESISTLSSLTASEEGSDSSLSSLESDEEEEGGEVEPAKKKARTTTTTTKVTGRKRGQVGGLPTPSPTSDGKSKSKKEKEKESGTKRTRDLKGRDGKSYLNAGLYWNQDSKDAMSAGGGYATFLKSAKGKGKGKGKKSEDDDAWKEKEDSLIMPLPVHFGETLIELEKDFRLAFDIMRDFAFDREGAPRAIKESVVDEKERERREQIRKPDKYGKIARNVYVERKPEKALLPAICQCKKPTTETELGCGEDCINRLMQYSCDPKQCPCGDKCSNLPLGMQKGVPEGKGGLRVVWTGDRGFGLKTSVDIKRGDFVIEYRGEIISRNESYRRVLTTYKDAKSYYFLDYDGWECLDAGQKGNASRFINHSCGPNLIVVRWKLNGLEEYQMGIFAKEDIPAGTELTYDYGWQNFADLTVTQATESSTSIYADDPSKQRCYCGAELCSGYLGGKKKEKEKVVDKVALKKKQQKAAAAARRKSAVVVKSSIDEGKERKVVKVIEKAVGRMKGVEVHAE